MPSEERRVKHAVSGGVLIRWRNFRSGSGEYRWDTVPSVLRPHGLPGGVQSASIATVTRRDRSAHLADITDDFASFPSTSAYAAPPRIDSSVPLHPAFGGLNLDRHIV
jgi:hypothetical protein